MSRSNTRRASLPLGSDFAHGLIGCGLLRVMFGLAAGNRLNNKAPGSERLLSIPSKACKRDFQQTDSLQMPFPSLPCKYL